LLPMFFCGPDSFISSFTQSCKDSGYPRSSIHSEHFTPPVSKDSSLFTAELTIEKRVFVSAGQRLLDELLALEYNVPYSCKVGSCGTFVLKVLVGKIAHYDSFFTEVQKYCDNAILCFVSRANGEKVVIDYLSPNYRYIRHHSQKYPVQFFM
jgi:ferredoxin